MFQITSRIRPLFSSLVALLAIVLVSCSSPVVSAPPEYTTAQLEQLAGYKTTLQAIEDRTSEELGALIDRQDWTYVRNFIHGPLGAVRQTMSLVSQNLLLPSDRQVALEQARDIFRHLEAIDQAAQKQDYKTAQANYEESLADFEAFLQLIPTSGADS